MLMQLVVIILAWFGGVGVLLALGIGVTELYDKLVVERIRQEIYDREEINSPGLARVNVTLGSSLAYWTDEVKKLRQEVSDLKAAGKGDA